MDPILKQVIQQLRSLAPRYCDVCGTQHLDSDFSFVGNRDGMLTFQISCGHCGSTDVLQMNPGSNGLSMKRYSAMNTDVKGAEFAKFAGKPQIEKEEALDIYTNLKSVETLEEFMKLVN